MQNVTRNWQQALRAALKKSEVSSKTLAEGCRRGLPCDASRKLVMFGKRFVGQCAHMLLRAGFAFA